MDLLWVLYAVALSVQGSLAADTYKAGVLEFYPNTKDTKDDTIRTNIQDYRQFVEAARSQNAQIVVFPEYGLTGLVDDPNGWAQEINEANTIIKELKDMAVDHNLYMVVNLVEKVQESNKKTKYYNTNLVFARNGSIILKYRKINLYNEPNLTPGDLTQNPIFTTDFDVTFATFTCFDIYFDNPSRRVLDNLRVTDIAYPAAWTSTVPFHTALTVQHGYAIANGVNILAANYGKPSDGHGGSGIYANDGNIPEVYIADTTSIKRIIQEVPKTQRRIEKTVCTSMTPFGLPSGDKTSNVSNFVTQRIWKENDYSFQNVDLSEGSKKYTVCDGTFCCNFTIQVAQKGSSDFYKIMAFDDIEEFLGQKYHTRYCSLVACENDDTSSCGKRVNSTTKFTKIKVEGNLKSEEGTFYVPVTLNTYLLPIVQTTYCNNPNNTDSHFIKFETGKATDNVLVFGIFGKTVNSASSIQVFSMFAFLIFTAIKNFVF